MRLPFSCIYRERYAQAIRKHCQPTACAPSIQFYIVRFSINPDNRWDAPLYVCDSISSHKLYNEDSIGLTPNRPTLMAIHFADALILNASTDPWVLRRRWYQPYHYQCVCQSLGTIHPVHFELSRSHDLYHKYSRRKCLKIRRNSEYR